MDQRLDKIGLQEARDKCKCGPHVWHLSIDCVFDRVQ